MGHSIFHILIYLKKRERGGGGGGGHLNLMIQNQVQLDKMY